MKIFFNSSDFARFEADFNSMWMVLRICKNVFSYTHTHRYKVVMQKCLEKTT
jgi:hypothetical protein